MIKFVTSIKLAFKILIANKTRTILSLLGIVIGITAVILILALGKGLENFIVSQVEIFGTDIIEVEVKIPQTAQISNQNIGGMVGGMQITTFKLKEAEDIAKLSNLNNWYAGIMSQQIISRQEKTEQSFIFGVTENLLLADNDAQIATGHFFSKNDNVALQSVVVLGAETKEIFFPGENALGKNIKIGKHKYRVIGVMKPRNSSGPFDLNKIIFIPLRTLQKKIMGINHIQFAVYKVRDMKKASETIAQIENLMRKKHKIKYSSEKEKQQKLKDDFAVMSIAEAEEMLNNIFSILNILLLSLASISLIVGGVGIMNVMYLAVTERTKEIGLRKSIGASNSDILYQFVFEAIILTLFGGFLGILLSYLLIKIITLSVISFGFNITFPITWQAVLIAFSFSTAIGLIFGYYPAKKASKLPPAEALRQE